MPNVQEAPPNVQTDTHGATRSGALGKTRVEKVNTYLSTISTTIAILGGLGTLGVYLAANFYTGLVEVRPQGQADFVAVRVYNQKGEASTFHGNRFPLMPGEYHLEIKTSDKAPFHADTTVEFTKTSVVDVPMDEAANDNPSRRRWWQLWKKKSDQ